MDKTNTTNFDGCTVFGFNHLPNYQSPIDRRIETWALNYAHSGSLYWSAGGSTQRELNGPVAFWTWPGVHYQYRPITPGGWDHYYVSWNGPRALKWQQNGLHPICQPGDAVRVITDPAKFRAAFESLMTLLADHARDDPLVVHHIEGLLLLALGQATEPLTENSVQHMVRDVAEALHADLRRNWDFEFEAEHIGISLTHFRRIWKSLTGISPVVYLNKARMDHAAALLRSGSFEITAVGEMVGINDPSYFYRLFRRFHNMPPGAYRAAYLALE